MWTHTWSLAVEEHFYLGLPIVLLVLANGGACLRRLSIRLRGQIPTLARKSHDPFRLLVPFAALVFVGLPIARCVHAWDLPYRHSTHLFPTHLRVDALLAGLLLAYAFHYHRSSL